MNGARLLDDVMKVNGSLDMFLLYAYRRSTYERVIWRWGRLHTP